MTDIFKKRTGQSASFGCTISSMVADGLLLVFCCLIFSSCVQPQRNRARFGGSRCHECHRQKAESYLQKSRVHKPVKEKECSRCHEPHGYIGTLHLWEQGRAELCFRCHPQVKAQVSSASVHQPVQKEKCTICHDPHASDNENLVKKSGQELCFGCHDSKPFTRPHKHRALEKGCLLCHLPHASGREKLLVAEEKSLCLPCHPMRDERLVAAHQGYPVESRRCSECHDPHSSGQESLLRTQVHKPMQDKKCSECHLPSDSKEPFRVKKEKIDDLCYQCHSPEKYRQEGEDTHQPIKEGKCLMCHAPHASDFQGLLSVRESQGCYQCHPKVLKETEQHTVHKPLKDDQCAVCHDPHSGKVKWPQNGHQADLCYQCHLGYGQSHAQDQEHAQDRAQEKGRKARHKIIHGPIQKGECLSCHAYHASPFPWMLKESVPALCYQCHPEEGKRFNRVHAHTPVQNGNCLGCHDAHGGNFKNLLLLPSEKLCSSCHLFLPKQLVQGTGERSSMVANGAEGQGDGETGGRGEVPPSPRLPVSLSQLEGASLHAPVREGQCMQCHDPHATDYKNMLIRDNGQVCLSSQCHQPLVNALGGDRQMKGTDLKSVPFKKSAGCEVRGAEQQDALRTTHDAPSFIQSSVKIHNPVKDYQCLACHNPHGSRIPHLLLSQSATLCCACHKGLEEKIKAANENVHPPVREGKCLTCHSGHGSGYPSLLAKGADSMCMECHRKDEKSFSLAHRHIEIKKEHCLECHDPHASEGKGLFRRVVHKPFQSKKCDVCHKNAR